MSNPNPPATNNPASVIPPPLRSDLVSRPQTYLGRSYEILKSPLALSYFRLPCAHVEAARAFDGKRSLGVIAGDLRRASTYWRGLTPEGGLQELAMLAQQLASAGLLRARGQGATERSRKMREAKNKRRFEAAIGHTMYFKKAIYDPNGFLGRWMPAVGFLFSLPAMVLAVLFVLSAAGVAIVRWDAITAQSANFFTLQNLGLTWVLFLGVKVVHEFGHAFTCKRFGGEVHEMGFMFILFTPYLFCNVSDSWLAKKWERVAVTAAGIGVELVLAAVATWLWYFSQPGLFHQMCFNTMALCSVSTVLFNANPLMKFDGYYIMTDLLEIPNLRAKSNAWVTNWAKRVLLGLPTQSATIRGEGGPAFGLYAVAAYLYGWIIVYNISIHIFNMLEPYGLQIVSRSYVALFLFVSLALPFWRLARNVGNSREMRTAGLARLRVLAVLALFAGAAFFVVPWTESISRSAALESSRIQQVSSPTAGFLREVTVMEGESVQAAQLLGRLENPELDAQLADLRSQRESAEVRLRAAMSDPSTEARLSAPVLEKYVREASTQILAMEERKAWLELRASENGIVRTKRPQDLLGLKFSAGQPVLEIGNSGAVKVVIALNEKEARKVSVGQPVRVRFEGFPSESFEGQITAIPPAAATAFSIPAFSNLFGGDVPSHLDAHQKPVPTLPHYEAEATVSLTPEAMSRLLPQAAAKAKIETGKTSLALWLRERLVDLVDPDLRL